MNATLSADNLKLDIDVPNDLAQRLMGVPDAKQFVVNALTAAFDEQAANTEWDRLAATVESQSWLAQQADQATKDYQAGKTQPMTNQLLYER